MGGREFDMLHSYNIRASIYGFAESAIVGSVSCDTSQVTPSLDTGRFPPKFPVGTSAGRVATCGWLRSEMGSVGHPWLSAG